MLLSALSAVLRHLLHFYLASAYCSEFIIAGYLSIYILNSLYRNNRNYFSGYRAFATITAQKVSILHRPKGSHQPSDLSAQNPLSSHWPFHSILYYLWLLEFTGKCNLWRLRPDYDRMWRGMAVSRCRLAQPSLVS